MECKKEKHVLKDEDKKRDYLKENQDDQRSNNCPLINRNILISLVNSEPDNELRLDVDEKMSSSSDKSQKDLIMKNSKSSPTPNSFKNKLSSLIKKFPSLKIKEKFESIASTEKSESKDVEEDRKSIDDSAEITAKLSSIRLTNTNQKGSSKKKPESKGFSECSSEGEKERSRDPPDSGSERDSKMKDNISKAERRFSEDEEEYLERSDSKLGKDSSEANEEKKKAHRSLREIIFGLEKTHLTERGGPDRIQHHYRPMRRFPGADLSYSMKTWSGQNDPSVQENNLRVTNSLGYDHNLRYTLPHHDHYPLISFNQTNILPLDSFDSSSEPVSIDEITPTLPLQNLSSDSSLNSHLFTESLELFSEIPKDALHSFSTSDEVQSSLRQKQHFGLSLAESEYAEPSLNLFQGDNFADVSEDRSQGYSGISLSHDQSSEGLDYLPDYQSEAVVPTGSFEFNHESVRNDPGLQVLSGNDTEKFFNSLSLSSIGNHSEQYETAQTFQHDTEQNQPLVRQSDEFGNTRTGFSSGEVTSPTIFPQSSSPLQSENSNSSISSTFSDLNSFFKPSLSSKITCLVKNTLEEPSHVSSTQYAGNAKPTEQRSFSQLRNKTPVMESLRSSRSKKTEGNSLRVIRVPNLQSVENQSGKIPNQTNGVTANSSKGVIKPITYIVKTFNQNKLMATPLFQDIYWAEYVRFEREIQELNLGTGDKKIIYRMPKSRRTKYQGTNLHVALKNLNIVRFIIILQKYREYHQSIPDVNVRDSDGKTVYDIAKKFMEDNIEYMDLVVKYLEENYAVEGLAMPR